MRKTAMFMVAAVAMFATVPRCMAMLPGADFPPPGAHAPEGRDPFVRVLARMPDLSEAQRKEIAAVLDEERKADRVRFEKELELREKLHGLTEAAAFQETAVKAAAGSIASLAAERIVARAKAHYRINAVLTPAQRGLVQQFRDGRERFPPHCRCGCGPDERDDMPDAPPEKGARP